MTSKTFALVALLSVAASHGAMLSKQLAARSISAAGLPDPHCKTGFISLAVSGKPLSCCPSYCGACNDYKTCKSVRGQDSTNACCASKVYEMRCGNAPANTCVKKCSETVPPCIMDVDAASFDIKVKTVNGVPPCGDVVPAARQMHNAAIAKGHVLTDIHKSSVTFDEAVGFAHAGKDALKADLDDPDFPEDYKKKAAAAKKKADLVIEHAEKEITKLEELRNKVNAIESHKEIPKALRLQVKELTLTSVAEDKDALKVEQGTRTLHYDAFSAVAKVAAKKAEETAAEAKAAAEAAAAAKKAAEEAAQKLAAKKAAEAAAAKKAEEEAAAKALAEKRAAEKKAAEEAAAAKKAAEEAAAKALAVKRAAEKKAAEAAKKAEEAKKKALATYCDPAAKVIKPTKAGVAPVNVTVKSQCSDGGYQSVFAWVDARDLGTYKAFVDKNGRQYGGEGVLTANHYKDGILCRSTTLGTWLEHGGMSCTAGPFTCKETRSAAAIAFYCPNAPWSKECGTCNEHSIRVRFTPSKHHQGHMAPGDVLEVFGTTEGPCQPGWNMNPCP